MSQPMHARAKVVSIADTSSRRTESVVEATDVGVSLNPGRISMGLGLGVAVLLLLHDTVLALHVVTGHGRMFGLGPVFDLDAEQNIPTLYSSLVIFFNALLCAIIWRVGPSRRRSDTMWLVLALALVGVGIDEFCSFHESLIEPLRRHLHLSGVFYFAWVLPYGAAALTLGAGLVPFLWRLPARTRWLLIVSGAIYVMGALGLEMLGGLIYETTPNKLAPGWMLFSTFEEVFEMSGQVLFSYAALDYLARALGVVAVRLGAGAAGMPAAGSAPRV